MRETTNTTTTESIVARVARLEREYAFAQGNLSIKEQHRILDELTAARHQLIAEVLPLDRFRRQFERDIEIAQDDQARKRAIAERDAFERAVALGQVQS